MLEEHAPMRRTNGVYFISYDCPDCQKPMDITRVCGTPGCNKEYRTDTMLNCGYVTYDVGLLLQSLLDGMLTNIV